MWGPEVGFSNKPSTVSTFTVQGICGNFWLDTYAGNLRRALASRAFTYALPRSSWQKLELHHWLVRAVDSLVGNVLMSTATGELRQLTFFSMKVGAENECSETYVHLQYLSNTAPQV